MNIRAATAADKKAVWHIMEPILRAGETFPLPRNLTETDATDYWFSASHQVFVAEENNQIVGTYYIRPNQLAGGSHVANCGYMVQAQAQGKGVARAMCEHSLAQAKANGYLAVQFNFVVSSNEAAIHLWQNCGFTVMARLPEAFRHPAKGYIDVLVMYRKL